MGASSGEAGLCHSPQKTTALSEVEALVQQLNKIQQQQPTPTPLIPCTWAPTLLSRASIEKENRCLLEQNAVYAEQVEINLQELFQSVAGGLLMATYQPFRGEMIYCQGEFCPLARNLGLIHLPWSLNCSASFCSSLCQPLTSFRIPAFVTSLGLPLQPSPFLFQVGREAAGVPGSLGD